MNKRNFVVGACATVAAGVSQACPGAARVARAGASEASRPGLPELGLDADAQAWARFTGHDFLLADGAARLTLSSVQPHVMPGSGEQFTLIFAVAGVPPMAGGRTLFIRPAEGGRTLPVFMQTAGQDAKGGGLLRAEFSHLA